MIFTPGKVTILPCMGMVFCTLLLYLTSCVSEAEPPPVSVPEVRLVSLARVVRQETLCLGGTLVPHSELELSCSVGGRVVDVPLREGARFTRGSLLVRLENPSLELERDRARQGVAQAQAALDLRKQALDEVSVSIERRLAARSRERASRELALKRVEEGARKLGDVEVLYEAGAVSLEGLRNARHAQSCLEEELSLLDLSLAEGAIGLRVRDLKILGPDTAAGFSADMVIGDDGPPSKELFASLVALHSRTLKSERAAARAQVDASLLNLEAAERALKELDLRAPFDGRILSTFVQEGRLLSAGETLLSVMEGYTLDAIVQVGEQYASELVAGLAAQCLVPSLDAHFEGEVDIVAARADRSSAALPARIRLKGDAPGLKPGLFANISLVLPSSREEKLLPRSSVQLKDASSGRCFELIGTQVHERLLRLGEERDGYIAVLSGLREEALVVEDPQAGLKGGDHVISVD